MPRNPSCDIMVEQLFIWYVKWSFKEKENYIIDLLKLLFSIFILIVYLSEILSDFQNFSLYRKLIKNAIDQNYGRVAALTVPGVPPSLKTIV